MEANAEGLTRENSVQQTFEDLHKSTEGLLDMH